MEGNTAVMIETPGLYDRRNAVIYFVADTLRDEMELDLHEISQRVQDKFGNEFVTSTRDRRPVIRRYVTDSALRTFRGAAMRYEVGSQTRLVLRDDQQTNRGRHAKRSK